MRLGGLRVCNNVSGASKPLNYREWLARRIAQLSVVTTKKTMTKTNPTASTADITVLARERSTHVSVANNMEPRTDHRKR